MELQERINAFLAGGPHAVVGASTDRAKYGNKVLRAYQQNRMPVYPINPKATEVEGLAAYPDLRSVPEPLFGVSIITPPPVTDVVLDQIASLGIRHVWLQPGSENPAVLEKARLLDLDVIAGGPCVLVALHYRED